MRTMLLVCVVISVECVSYTQEVRTEKTTASNPADDSRPNSDSIPDVYALASQFNRVEIVRMKSGADLLAGLERWVKTGRIRNAVILSAVGSVKAYTYHTVSNGTFPSKNVFVQNPDGPADLLSMNGYIIEGRVHAHVTFANPDRAFGGHLESGTTVFTFAVVTVGILKEGIDLNRVDDKTYR